MAETGDEKVAMQVAGQAEDGYQKIIATDDDGVIIAQGGK